MCFSASASFLAGSALLATGSITMRRTAGTADFAFATIPILFGIQQVIEGVLWLAFSYNAPQLKTAMTYFFTLFSHVIWPLFVPFAIARMEPSHWRKRVMWCIQCMGVVVALRLLAAITTEPLTAEAGAHIIYLSSHVYDWPMMTLYIAATCLAPMCSSTALVRTFGATTLLLCAIAYIFYTQAFFSVWCFFAAILSLMIYIHSSRLTTPQATPHTP